MASKSKRRGRVFRASCILAALIIAGSSFAWFTSKDEVTNRLTASSDYGVSIVESFTPPANWLPGQAVNKDVYAVNTGNIDAFVNEDVTGVLNYTYERLVAEPDTTNGVKLNAKEIDNIAKSGVTTYEAASYLAWSSVQAEELGDKIIKADGSGWTPSATGVYIFRRSITHDDPNNANHPTDDTFAYSGYYYNASTGDYYKIVIGDDNFPYADGKAHEFDILSRSLGEGVVVDENGKVTSGTPTVRYVKLGKVEDKKVKFLYEDKAGEGTGNIATNHPARLVVTDTPDAITTDSTTGNTYNASANAARAEIEYLNALKLSNDATQAYTQAKTDFDYANALIKARNDLVDAAKTAWTANNTASSSTTTSASSIQAYTDKATEISSATGLYGNVYNMNASTGTIGKYTLVADEASTSTSLRGKIAALADSDSQVKKNLTDFDKIYNDMYGAGGTASQITTKLSDIATTKNGDDANSVAETKEAAQELADLVALVNQMDQQLTDYEATFANLAVSTAAANAGTLITTTQETAAKTAIDAVKAQVTALKNALTDGNSSLKALIAKAKTDATTMENDAAANTTAGSNWSQAVSDYNTAVTTAANAYDAVVSGTNKFDITQPDGTTHLTLTDNKSTLNESYSANGTTGTFGTDPTIVSIYDGSTKDNTPDNGSPLTKLTVLEDTTFPTSDPRLATLKSSMDTAVGTTNTKKTAYEQALNALKDDSSIIIYVNLANNYQDAWQFDPNTNGTETASFYLKHILEAGHNSEQLIDSIYLDDSVTAAAYKDMTFDLNVLLDSAQVTFADDQKTITSTAVIPENGFGLSVKTDGINQTTKDVTWDLPTT